MATIRITDLYNEVFGITPKYLVPRRGGIDLVSDRGYSEIPVFEAEEVPKAYSPLGTPILDVLMLQSGSYNSFEIKDSVPVKRKVDYPAYNFELWPMVDVSQDKVIINTPINGRDGTVKEYIYTDDFQISIRGLLVGEGNNYPHDQRRELHSTFKVNSTYGVLSRVLNDLGCYALVLKSIQFQDVEGYNNICQYTITAVSDKDVLLTIKDKRKI